MISFWLSGCYRKQPNIRFNFQEVFAPSKKGPSLVLNSCVVRIGERLRRAFNGRHILVGRLSQLPSFQDTGQEALGS